MIFFQHTFSIFSQFSFSTFFSFTISFSQLSIQFQFSFQTNVFFNAQSRFESIRNFNFLIVNDETINEIIHNFFIYKLKRIIDEVKRNKILLLHQLIEQKKWIEKNFKIMHNVDSTSYRIVYKTNFFDRMLRDIDKKLKTFKFHYKTMKSLLQLQKKKFEFMKLTNFEYRLFLRNKLYSLLIKSLQIIKFVII